MPIGYTFSPPFQPDWGVEHQQKPVTLKAQFGDGYSQRVADGQNNRAYSLTLTWTNLTTTERDSIINFFKARQGYQPFFYTYQDESSSNVYICSDWEVEHIDTGYYSVTATFQQVYDSGLV
jgi:phage-related protein